MLCYTKKCNRCYAIYQLITKAGINLRKAYGRYTENYTRRASFAGTGNEGSFLTDVTGNRRFLTVEALEIDLEHYKDLPMVYAQAFYLSKTGYKYWFDGAEIDEINKQNEQFRDKSAEEEIIMDLFEPGTKEDHNVFLTSTDVQERIIIEAPLLRNKINVSKVGRILTALGFEKGKNAGGDRYGYFMKERSKLLSLQIQKILPESKPLLQPPALTTKDIEPVQLSLFENEEPVTPVSR